jgi:hypothetical protein
LPSIKFIAEFALETEKNRARWTVMTNVAVLAAAL